MQKKVNPLQKLFEDIDDVDHKIEDCQNDILIGCFSATAKDRAMENLRILVQKKEFLEKKLERAQEFFIAYANAQKNPPIKEDEHARYVYFQNTLEPHTYRHTPADMSCNYCGRLVTSRTGIVYTFDPLSNELVDICANCYIERKQKDINGTIIQS